MAKLRASPLRLVLEMHEDFAFIEVKVFVGKDAAVMDPRDDERVIWTNHPTFEGKLIYQRRVKTRVVLGVLGLLTGGLITNLVEFT